MATRHKLPFVVQLKSGSIARPFRNFTTDALAAEIDETQLEEFMPWELEFLSLSGPPPEVARLYVDGFDALVDTDDVLQMDNGRIYIPCGTKVRMQGVQYDEKGRGEQVYPWIPGNYRVEVQWGSDVYYTVLRVQPKDMDDRQLAVMREELERYVVGLTLDIIRRNQGIGQSELATMLPPRFYQYQLLSEKFSTIQAVLQDIIRKPKHEVRRKHHVVTAAKNMRRDERSYRWAHSARGHARNQGATEHRARFAYAPYSRLHYDLPENRWVKKIVASLVDLIDDIVGSIERFSAEHEQASSAFEAELKRQLADIENVRAGLRMVLTHPIFQEVATVRGPLPHTPAMQKDGRYRTLYQFWWNLQSHSQVRVDASFEYQWKRTDLLWEYWTLVRTIEALEELGFEPVSGWIFDKDWQFPQRILIPVIPEGTRVVLSRGDERIVMSYEERLPHRKDEAEERGFFLHVEGPHNWPDVRLDYFRGGVYKYSVVVEAKYRPARNIWSDDKAEQPWLWTNIMQQLRSYRIAISLVEDPMRRAVKEVITIYPRDRSRPAVDKVADHITLVQLSPGSANEHYKQHLARYWG